MSGPEPSFGLFGSPQTASPRITDATLSQSMRLLTDALNSPSKSTLRVTRSTPIRRSLAMRRDPLSPDVSTIHPAGDTPNKRFRSFRGLSVTLDPHEYGDVTVDTSTTARLDLLKEASDHLFTEFLKTMQSHGTEQQVFETVSDFIQNCSDVLDILQSLDPNPQRMDLTVIASVDQQRPYEWLIQEYATWCLVYCLYGNRLSSRNTDIPQGHDHSVASPLLSEKKVVEELYRNDTVVRECQLVVDWLEQQAAFQMAKDNTQIPHFTDKAVAWENTLHQLKNNNRSIAFASSRPIVDKLDPDAPLRENKVLHDLDREDEVKLTKALFVEIRCGRLEEAQNICVHCGQPWRAASLEGWRLYHDPNYESSTISSGEKLPVEGNPNRDLWKFVAWNLANDARLAPYVRAVHAAFCGHLDALDAVCYSWCDKLWAYLRIIIDVRVEEEIRDYIPRSYVPMPEAYWQNKFTVEEVFTKLSSSNSSVISAEAVSPARIIQKYLILDQIPELMKAMVGWSQSCSPQFLRCLAHLVLFFRLIGCNVSEEVGDIILVAYVKLLMKMKEPQLVAYYVAALPQEDQVQLFAQFLEDIKDNDKRKMCLTVAEDVGLDEFLITKTVVENIRNRETANEYPDLHGTLTAEDLEKISALDWLTFYDTHYPEALWQANAMIRLFLAVGKLEAARKAYNKIPMNAVNVIIRLYSQSEAEDGSEEPLCLEYLPQRVSNSVREYLCHRTYLDAQESFAEWFHNFHNAKPTPPAAPAGDATFTEKVAYEHRRAQYKAELDRWRLAMQQQTKTVKGQLTNVLTFPEGGWLVDVLSEKGLDEELTPAEEEENKRRQLQMESLRKLCIPKVVLLLVTLMQKMGENEQCVQLADLVMSEQYQLYKVYSPQKLGELLKKLLESVHELVNQKKDPWGFPTTDEM